MTGAGRRRGRLGNLVAGFAAGAPVAALPAGSGVPYMIASTLALSIMQALVRNTGQELHPFVVAFFRSVFGMLVLLPVLIHAGAVQFRTRRFAGHMSRGAVGAGSMIAWFYALSLVPIAEATALSFVGIVFAAIGAVLFLKETMGAARWLAVAVCFAGVLVMLRPGFQEFNAGMWMVILSALGWGIGLLLVKDLARTESATCIVGWNVVLLTLVTMFPALWVWQWPTFGQIFVLVAIGVLGTLGHLLAARALQLSSATVVLPLIFTSLIWAALIGFVAFGEFPDLFAAAGSVLIVAGAAYLTRTPTGGRGHNKA